MNPKRRFQLFILVSVVSAFLFTACSHSKKKTGEKSTTATTQQNSSQATTNKNNNSTQSKAITAARGHKIASSNGCFSCHSIDGTQRAVPTFKNLYGRKTTLKNGMTIVADSAYIAQSIEDPEAKIVKGFSPIMPRFSYLKSDQIASLIAYIKSISE